MFEADVHHALTDIVTTLVEDGIRIAGNCHQSRRFTDGSCTQRVDGYKQVSDYSTESDTRSAKATAIRVHQLDLKTPLPARDAVLKNSANKTQLNLLICEQIIFYEQYLHQVTQHHTLVVAVNDAIPSQVSKGQDILSLDHASTQEEAKLIITQLSIHLAKEEEESRVYILHDDTGVFPLLAKYFQENKSSLR